MEAKKNPLIAGLLTLAPQIVSGITSFVKDKREKREEKKNENATVTEVLVDSVKEITAGTFSSKRLMNVGGTAILIYHGISTNDVRVMALGVVYSIGMGIITYLSEKK